jgi:Zn-dependent peptidase ImmA (M78 family)
MRRGFKSQAEDKAVELRKLLGLTARDCLPARKLAAALGIVLKAPREIPGMPAEALRVLLRGEASGWSAVTLPSTDPVIVIYNASHTAPRQESDLMHEIAHVLCEHEGGSVTTFGGLPCRDYDPVQEEEAGWLGACLQIPRDGLLWCIKNGWDTPAIAQHFGASLSQTIYRRNKTGVDAQMARARASSRWKH